MPAPTVHDCSLAAEEVLANIAKHACGGSRESETRVVVRLLSEEIQIRFEDAGPPFNPLAEPAPDLDAPLAARVLGRGGLVLVKHLVDRCEYAREGETNVFTVHISDTLREEMVPGGSTGPARAMAERGTMPPR